MREVVKPCLEELKQSATKLKKLILVCSNKLDYAENVWLSKPKIAEAAKHKIWEHIGEMTGCSVKICQLGNQCKTEAIKQAKLTWDSRIKYLRNKWFIDAKKQPKKGICWDDKKVFLSEIKPETEKQCEKN